MIHTVLGILFVFGALLLVAFVTWVLSCPERVFHRGAQLMTQNDAHVLADRKWAGLVRASFSGVLVPLDVLVKGMLLLASPGAGKTISMFVTLSSLIATTQRGLSIRFIAWDPRGEFYSMLRKLLPPHHPAISLSPLDANGWSFSFAREFADRAAAPQLSETLIPDESRGDDRYFVDASRCLVTGVIVRLQSLMPQCWQLRHVILCCESLEVLYRFLMADPETRRLCLEHLKVKKTARSIVSTMQTYLGKYATVAAGWSHAPQSVSIREFMDFNGGALVLPCSHRYEAVLNPINALLLRRATDELVHRSDPGTYSVFALDEFGTLRADLSKLLLMARGAGGIPFVAVQDVNTLIAEFGESKAHAMLALLQNRIYLKTDGTASPNYQSDTFGGQENLIIPPDGNLRGARIESRRLVTASEFQSLPLADWNGDCIDGYAKISDLGTFHTRYAFRDEIDRINAIPSPGAFVARSDAELTLEPLTRAEKLLLGLI